MLCLAIFNCQTFTWLDDFFKCIINWKLIKKYYLKYIYVKY